MAKRTKEEQAHHDKLLARRNRRARRKAETARSDEALVAQHAENAHADDVALPAPARVDSRVLGAKQQVLAGSVSPKRITEARENLSIAFDQLGGIPMLVAWGTKNLTEFYRIWARLIPKEESTNAARNMPLEDLLDKLAARADQQVVEAARAIGEEVLAEAATLDDAVAAFEGSVH